MRLKDKVALVTGASGGLGGAICEAFAKEGAHCLVVFRSDREEAEKTAEKVRALGGRAEIHGADVSDDGHVGVCLDSCHIFAAGYPITEPSDYVETMRQFDSIVGRSRIKIFHINDSKRELGSKVDRHEHIGQGEIGPGGFANIVNDPGMEAVPMILETPKGDDLQEDIDNLKLLRSMVKES